MTTEQHPPKFTGRKGSACSRCKGSRHWQNRLGGLSCEKCRPPGEADAGAVILDLRAGAWTDTGLRVGRVDEWQPESVPDFLARDYGGPEPEQKREPEIFDWDAARKFEPAEVRENLRPEPEPIAINFGPPRFWAGAIVHREKPIPSFRGPVCGPFVVTAASQDFYGREVLNLAIGGREILTGVSAAGFEPVDFGF